MSDLNFNELNAEPLCPTDSFILINGKVYLDIGVFIGENVTSLATPKVTELAIKLGRVGHAAQTTVNPTRPTGAKVNVFQLPSFSPPQIVGGVLAARISVTAQGNLGVNPDDINPVLI